LQHAAAVGFQHDQVASGFGFEFEKHKLSDMKKQVE
jgi:hypothetical protein